MGLFSVGVVSVGLMVEAAVVGGGTIPILAYHFSHNIGSNL